MSKSVGGTKFTKVYISG